MTSLLRRKRPTTVPGPSRAARMVASLLGAGLLHSRQQERHEHADDCDDHEQLHERESHTPRASRIRDAHSRLPLRQMQREDPFARTQFANLDRIIALPRQNVTAKIADFCFFGRRFKTHRRSTGGSSSHSGGRRGDCRPPRLLRRSALRGYACNRGSGTS